MHRDLPGLELCVQRVGVAGVDVGVPPGPFVARMVRLWMDLRGDGLEHKHDLVASDEGPEVVGWFVAASFVEELESQFGLIEVEGLAQVVNDEEGGDAVQHAGRLQEANIKHLSALLPAVCGAFGRADKVARRCPTRVVSDPLRSLTLSGWACGSKVAVFDGGFIQRAEDHPKTRTPRVLGTPMALCFYLEVLCTASCLFLACVDGLVLGTAPLKPKEWACLRQW